MPKNFTDTPPYDPEEQELDQIVAQAVEAAAKGENVEQLMEVMLASANAAEKDKLRKKFSNALSKRGLRQPSGEGDIPSRTTLARIKTALAVSTRQMVDRILQLTRARPDIAASIQQAGQMLAKNGVVADRVSISEADLGNMPPAVSAGKSQSQGTSR